MHVGQRQAPGVPRCSTEVLLGRHTLVPCHGRLQKLQMTTGSWLSCMQLMQVVGTCTSLRAASERTPAVEMPTSAACRHDSG